MEEEHEREYWQSHFKNIFLEYYNSLCIYAYRYLRDKDVSEDIVQDVFASIWDRRDKIDFSIPIKSLLYKYTHNKVIDHLKSHAFNNERLDAHTEFIELDNYIKNLLSHQPEEYLHFQELNREIQKCIDNLPQPSREIYTLSRVTELKNKEIAVRLNISIKTVEKHISKALHEIRMHLNKKGFLSSVLVVVSCASSVVLSIFK